MNWRTFVALLRRDARVARRNAKALLLQTLFQPMMFVFVFGRIMTASGFMPAGYKLLLLPGIIAISMVFSGIWSVAMPLIAEFQFTKEIEDRLLAPMEIEWLAVEKVVAGMVQAIVAGLIVVPLAAVIMGADARPALAHPFALAALTLLVSFLAAALGLVIGCTVGQTQVGLMFSLVVTPMVMFGCAYYPWSALASFPVMQKAVLINPLVYASEGFRGVFAPDAPHLPMALNFTAIGLFDVVFLGLGLRQFRRKAIG